MSDLSLVQFLLQHNPLPSEWRKIPWHDPDFSRRMLHEHLSQDHDAASRRSNLIDEHVNFIHRKLLRQQPVNILDLGCGPGFYCDRLTARGHTCTGIDISPASLDYAREHHSGTFRQGDMRNADYGNNYDLVLLISGELNAFAPDDAQTIINKAYAALKPGGALVLEVSYPESLNRHATAPKSWFVSKSGLFGDSPHLCLSRSFLDLDRQITHFYVLGDGANAFDTYTAMHQIYTEDEYRHLLGDFAYTIQYPSLTGRHEPDADFMVLVATRSET